MTVSPQVSAAAASTRTEAEARGTKAIALKLVQAKQEYSRLCFCNKEGKTADELAEIEIELARAYSAMGKLSVELSKAVAA